MMRTKSLWNIQTDNTNLASAWHIQATVEKISFENFRAAIKIQRI